MEEWKEYKLGDLYDVHNGLSKGGKFFGSGYPFLSFRTVFNNYFLPPVLPDLVQSDEKEQNGYNIKRGDVFVTRTSETPEELGMSSVALKDYPFATYNGFTKRLRPKNPSLVFPEFIGYYLRSTKFRNFFYGLASSMSTRASLANGDLLGIRIFLPSYETQKRIAWILKSLDDKIELNRHINENLEQQAQALFKSWFVDFEPFKKCEFIESELGIIPKGWRVIPISEIFNFQEGPGIRNWQYVNNNGTKFINIRCINNNIINVSNANMISNEEAQGKYAHFMLNENDIVMSCSGTLGRSAIVLKEYLPLCLNTSVIRFTPKIERQLGLLYGYLGSSLFLNKQMELATGSAQVNFGPTHLKEMSIAVPNDDILNNFSDIVNSMIIKKKAIISEIIHLNNLRDTLLPKLMSGELKFSEMETKLDE